MKLLYIVILIIGYLSIVISNDIGDESCDYFFSNFINNKCIQFSITGIDSDNLNQENYKGNLRLLNEQLIPVSPIINSINGNLKTFCNSKGLLQPIADHLKIKDFKLDLNGTIKLNNKATQINCQNEEYITFKLINFTYLLFLKGFNECPNILNLGETCKYEDSESAGLLSNTPNKLPICQPRDNPIESTYCPGSFQPIGTEKNGGFKIKLDAQVTKKGRDKNGDNFFEHKVIVTNNETYGVKNIRIHSDKYIYYLQSERFPNGDFMIPYLSLTLKPAQTYTFVFNCSHSLPTLTVVNLVMAIKPH